jgi:hypothetical protein
VGHSAITTDSPPVSVVQRTSVTNGITGCSTQQLVEDGPEDKRGGVGAGAALGDLNLRQLEVPVADLVPREVVERLTGLRELVRLEACVDVGQHLVESAEDPAVGLGEVVCRRADRPRVHRSSSRTWWR